MMCQLQNRRYRLVLRVCLRMQPAHPAIMPQLLTCMNTHVFHACLALSNQSSTWTINKSGRVSTSCSSTFAHAASRSTAGLQLPCMFDSVYDWTCMRRSDLLRDAMFVPHLFVRLLCMCTSSAIAHAALVRHCSRPKVGFVQLVSRSC